MTEGRFRSLIAARLAVALFAAGFALFQANSGCAPATVCFRNTDCGVGSDCKQGVCVRRVASSSDAGVAGGASDDAGTTGSDMSAAGAATNTAGTSGSGGAGTSGSSGASTAGDTGTAGASTGGDTSTGGANAGDTSTGGAGGGGVAGGGGTAGA